MKMNLTETPKIVMWPETHYVFIEKFGPFQETAMQAWMEMRGLIPTLLETEKITKRMTLYKMEPGKMTYRAGVALAAKPSTKLPDGLRYENFPGGRYSCFVLTGTYSSLPEACGRVFDIVEETKMQVRDDFNIEHYTNCPETTPEEQLITEILIPTL